MIPSARWIGLSVPASFAAMAVWLAIPEELPRRSAAAGLGPVEEAQAFPAARPFLAWTADRIIPRRFVEEESAEPATGAEAHRNVILSIVREDGRAIANAQLEVHGPGGETWTTTDVYGRAEMPAAPGAAALVRVRRADFDVAELSVALDAGERQVFVPTRSSVLGRVTLDGQVPTFPVRVELMRSDGHPSLYAMSGTDGSFELFNLPVNWSGQLSFPNGRTIAHEAPVGRIASAAVLETPGEIEVGSFLSPIAPASAESVEAFRTSGVAVTVLSGSGVAVAAAGGSSISSNYLNPGTCNRLTILSPLIAPPWNVGDIELSADSGQQKREAQITSMRCGRVAGGNLAVGTIVCTR